MLLPKEYGNMERYINNTMFIKLLLNFYVILDLQLVIININKTVT